jgi:hypothetical protein
MTVGDVIYKVKARMQELTPFGEGLAIADPASGNPLPVTSGLLVLRPERYEKPVETYIAESLNEAYSILVGIAPRSLVPVKAFPAVPVKRQDGSGSVELPPDFFRLVSFRMSGWQKPVTEATETDSQEYQLQFIRYARGGISRPVCAIKKAGDGKLLEYFSLPEYLPEHEVEELLYVPNLFSENECEDVGLSTPVKIDSRLADVFVYIAASRVYAIYERPDMGKVMMEGAMELINALK